MAISVNVDVNHISAALKYYKAFQGGDNGLLIGAQNDCRASFLVDTTLWQNSFPQLIDGFRIHVQINGEHDDSSLELVYPLSRHLDDPSLGYGEAQFDDSVVTQ